MLALLLLACEPPPGEPGSLNLSRDPQRLVHLELPASTLSAEGLRERLALTDWTRVEARDGVVVWSTELPLAYIDVGHSSKRQPHGLVLQGPFSLRWARLGPEAKPAARSWDLRGTTLLLRLSEQDGPPEDIHLSYQRALEAEQRLNLEHSGLSEWDFLTGPVQIEEEHARGLLLPPPGVAEFELLVPQSAVLGFHARLLRGPWTDRRSSDGAELRVLVDGEEVERLTLKGQKGRQVRVDLEDHGGRTVRLRLETHPGEDGLNDLVFLDEPALYTPSEQPRRVVLVFLDTLRADHLGVYGYTQRPTSPGLDAWAAQARVFEQAIAPASWTLPSARSALSGRMPDRWEPDQSLPAVLAREGFLTRAWVTNAFLTPRFGMGESWAWYGYDFLGPADEQVDRALAALEDWPDRDQLLMLHLFDAHLPYREPEPWSSMWAGETPEVLEGVALGRTELSALSRSQSEEARPYLEARYDQNIRFMDEQLARLFAELGPQDLVVVYSDHGEEFWDHGGFEHGHALHEELVRVPLLVKGPGVPAGREPTPVGLVDLTPTVLELLGLPLGDVDGVSLLAPQAGRSLAFGFKRYGADAWGVRVDQGKWTHSLGRSLLFDLASDPGEERGERPDFEQDRAWAEALSQGLGRPVDLAWRLSTSSADRRLHSTTNNLVVRLSAPQALRAVPVWDPLERLAKPSLDEEGRVVVSGGSRELGYVPTELYVVPEQPLRLHGVLLQVERPGQLGESLYEGEDIVWDGLGRYHLFAGRGALTYRLSLAWAPGEARQALPGVTEQDEEQLRSLGYVE